MNTSFMKSSKLVFTSESVTEGHPDKMCDQISDAILDESLSQDPFSRVACEAAVKTGFVMIMGEITTQARLNYDRIVRKVVTDIGYDRAKYGFDGLTCGVQVAIAEQSGDIAQGVDKALEAKTGEMSEEEIDAIGAGDQGMMFGYACTETDVLMPLPLHLSHKLTRKLAAVRKAGELDWLRPDGKAQVTVEYEYGQPKRIDTVLVSTQHSPDVSYSDLRDGIIESIINPTMPRDMVDDELKVYVNPTGRFVIGGPMGDAGVTGRKIIVDTYGGMGRHGGGCFVAAGLADRCEIQVSYAIGVAHPLSVNVETFDTNRIEDSKIVELVNEFFDLRPGAIIRDLGLRRPIYQQTAAYGHFGRDDLDLPWERTDKAEALKEAAGI